MYRTFLQNAARTLCIFMAKFLTVFGCNVRHVVSHAINERASHAEFVTLLRKHTPERGDVII